MAVTDTRLRILTFPQGWDGAGLAVRILVSPAGNPLLPLNPGLPPFAQANLKMSARLIPGLDRLPQPADVAATVRIKPSTPADLETVYDAYAAKLSIDPAAPPAYVAPANTRILKLVMPSYLEATGFDRPRTELAVTDNSFACALVDGERPVKRPPIPPGPPVWNSALAMAIRQPLLAGRLGLLYIDSVELPAADFFSAGGWIFVSLDPDSDYFAAALTPDFLKLHAARIRPLAAGRSAPVFAPVLFPVTTAPSAVPYDEVLQEAETYAAGFAQIVHTFQPDRADYLNLSRQDHRRPLPFQECGIKLGWDDEQIVIWLNRQLTDDPRNSPTARDTPMGVRGFRVDVRDAEGPGPWVSLVRMNGALDLGGVSLGTFDGEMGIELAPSQLQGRRDGDYWLPPYFTQWTGASLVAADATAVRLSDNAPSPRVLDPVDDDIPPLRYGRLYQFRVRLMDLTGGGPEASASGEPADSIATRRFRRYLPPGQARIPDLTEDGEALTCSIRRPLLGYPALVYTSLANAENLLLADVPASKAQNRLPGYPDPDVAVLRIDVAVASLEADPGNDGSSSAPRQLLYTAFRDFPADPEAALDLRIEFRDEPDLANFPGPAAAGPLQLPTARDVSLTFTPIARQDPGFPPGVADPAAAATLDPAELDLEDPKLTYFGKYAARVGASHTVSLRREASDERSLFGEIPGLPFQGVFLRPDPEGDVQLQSANAAAGTQEEAPEYAPDRLARQLRLNVKDLVFSAAPGERVVFGASAGLRHHLSPDHSTITFAGVTEITSQWVMVVPLRLEREWTWDGVGGAGFEISRRINGGAQERVGALTPERTLSATAVRRPIPLDRSHTNLIFFDAIDPKPLPGAFPSEITVEYLVTPVFRQPPGAPPPEWRKSIFLPIAAPPSQVPRLVSAGLALSPYRHDDAYSATEPRSRRLWLEFAEPVLNPRDRLFGRVLMHSVDPMLSRAEPSPPPGPLEPPLNLNPEMIRAILPGQPADELGLDALEPLIPAAGPGPVRHFLLPLPKALSHLSPELFGFFVYEFRIGHKDGWCLERARHFLPLRVSGVQHPAPVLACNVSRDRNVIAVSAPYANPVANGRSYRPEPPATDLWAMLYVQVRQADAAAWRNLLLGRARLRYDDHAVRGRSGPDPQGVGYWDQSEVERWLRALSLPLNAPLSVVAVELLPEVGSPFVDPLCEDLGQVRILRQSCLTPVPAVCVDG